MNFLSYAKMITVACIAAIILGFVWYINNLKSTLAETEQNLVLSQQNEAKLTAALETERETLKKKELEYSTIVKLTGGLRNITINQAKEIKALNDKLNVKANGQSRDLGNIARVKPKIIQGIVNKATDNVNRCFEILTGSPIKEGEVNNGCKDLIIRTPR